MPIKPILEEDVLIKGSSNGILIVLNLNQDYERLIKKLVQKVKKDKKFLSESRLSIKGVDRSLDKDELGMARKMVADKTGLQLFSPEDVPRKEEWSDFQKVLETKKPDIIENTLRAGENLVTQNDVVIFGDINPGASVISSGSVFVYGKIRGSLQAGHPENKEAVVCCSGFSPILFSLASLPLPPEFDQSTVPSVSCYLKIEEQELRLIPFKKD